MNKKTIIILAVVLIVLIIGILFFATGRSGKNRVPFLPDQQFEGWSLGSSVEGADIFDEEGMLTFDALAAQARAGKISLVAELWRMRRKCPQDMEFNDCNEKLRTFISKKFAFPDNEKLVALLDKYLKYEKTMGQFKIPEGLTSEQRYSLIKQKRREVFGNDDASLVFGLEESKVNFNFAYQGFAKSTAGQTGDARVAAYEALRKKTYGNYYDALVAAEPAYSKYETEQALRDTDLKNASNERRGAMIQSMREKYFGPEGARRLSDLDKQMESDAVKEGQLDAAEKKFMAENASMSEQEKESGLMQLRKQYLGDEAAEEYARRKQYEKYLSEQK